MYSSCCHCSFTCPSICNWVILFICLKVSSVISTNTIDFIVIHRRLYSPSSSCHIRFRSPSICCWIIFFICLKILRSVNCTSNTIYFTIYCRCCKLIASRCHSCFICPSISRWCACNKIIF